MSTIPKSLPTTPNPHLGFELEFDLHDHTLLGRLQEKLLALHPSTTLNYEAITYTYSPTKGYEFTMCIEIGFGYRKAIIDVCRILSEDPNVFFDHRCGLHIHLDARQTSPFELRRRLAPHEKRLMSFISENRRKLGMKCWNPDPLWVRHRYDTLEVRYMEGNCDANRILQYVETLLQLSQLHDTSTQVACVA